MMTLLLGQQSVVVWDAKHYPNEWPAFAARHGYVVTSDPEDIRRHPKVVYQIDELWLLNRAGWKKPGSPGYAWTLALQYAYERGQTIHVHDESLATIPSGTFHPLARKAV